MRRSEAILVIVALLASPLALVARGIFCNPSQANCMMACAHASLESKTHCAAGHAPMCGTHPGNRALDYGFVAPFAPALPLPYAQLSGLAVSFESMTNFEQSSVDGIFGVPFEPPRS